MSLRPAFSAMPALAIAVKTKKIIRRFRDSDSTSIWNAKTPEQLNLSRGFLFDRLVNQDVIVRVGNSRYYLREKNIIHYQTAKRKRLLLLLGILLLVFVIYLFTNRHHL